MRAIAATVFGTLIALGALGAWYYTAPAPGSGWILFVAFVGSLGVIGNNSRLLLSALSCLAITVAAGAIWYVTRSLDHSGWVLCLAVLGGLGTFGRLNKITITAE